MLQALANNTAHTLISRSSARAPCSLRLCEVRGEAGPGLGPPTTTRVAPRGKRRIDLAVDGAADTMRFDAARPHRSWCRAIADREGGPRSEMTRRLTRAT